MIDIAMRKISRPALSDMSRKVLGCRTGSDVENLRYQYEWWTDRNQLAQNIFEKTDWAFEYFQNNNHPEVDQGWIDLLFKLVHDCRECLMDKDDFVLVMDTFNTYGYEGDETKALLKRCYSDVESLDATTFMRAPPKPQKPHESWGSFA